jgi:hypothetical protein
LKEGNKIEIVLEENPPSLSPTIVNCCCFLVAHSNCCSLAHWKRGSHFSPPPAPLKQKHRCIEEVMVNLSLTFLILLFTKKKVTFAGTRIAPKIPLKFDEFRNKF